MVADLSNSHSTHHPGPDPGAALLFGCQAKEVGPRIKSGVT